MSSSDKCACTSGCTTRRCNCVKEVRKCQKCRCDGPCKNPLNILEEFEVDLAEAKNDRCLMQSLPKVGIQAINQGYDLFCCRDLE